MNIKIGNNEINDKRVFIIAEAGVNHNGSIELAKRLVDKAKNCGADCVKFQTFKAENLVTKNAPKANYQMQVTDKAESQFDMLKKLELNLEEYKELMDYCHTKDILFLSTPYNFEDIDFLDKLDVAGFKVASGQLVELPFLEYMAKKNRPIIISTGMSYLEDVKKAKEVFEKNNFEDYVFLQCTTNYPSLIEESNINAMITMRNELESLVGYSDHTEDEISILAAVSLGACVIEKHFTLDKKMDGPDHLCSADPKEMKELINKIRKIEIALGSCVKEPAPEEKKNIQGMRRSLCLNKSLKKDEIIERSDIGIKRPATGLNPNYFNELVGKKVNKDLEFDHILSEEDIDWNS